MSEASVGQTVEALLSSELLTTEQVDEAVVIAAQRSQTVLQVLLDTGAVDRKDVVRTAANSAGLAYVDLAEYTVNSSAAAMLPADFARRLSLIHIFRAH